MKLLEKFGATMCDYQDQFRLGFVFGILLLIFTLVSFPFLTPGTPSYAIALIDLVLTLFLIGITGTSHWYCVRYEQRAQSFTQE